MDIKNKEDWWIAARAILPHLKGYAKSFDINFDDNAANEELVYQDHRSLYQRLHSLWFDLPDCKEIRRLPFFDLCDLCSEYWVFEKGD